MQKIIILILVALLISGGAYFWLKGGKNGTSEFLQPSPLTQPEAPPKKGFAPHPEDTISGMAERAYDGSDLQLKTVLAENDAYTRYQIFYQSQGLTISGVANLPKGKGPFPVLVINHGYVDPKVYTPDRDGVQHEQDFFARHGYAVFHSDYRGYGASDPDPLGDIRPRSGYVEDVLNLVSAVKNSGLKKMDPDNIGMLGHSMGGGITENIMVTKPDIAKAFVLLAPINSDYQVNFDTWVKDEWPETAEQFYQVYGRPEENPDFWHDISAKNFVDRIQAPVMLHQGTADDQVPVQWSEDFAGLLRQKGKDITYYEYPGEGHIFGAARPLVMERTLPFLDARLKK